MKIALVGVGGMGGLHLDIYKNTKDIDLIAACDVRPDMLKEKTEGLNIKLYSDYDEMLRCEQPDIVDICTPTYLHAEQSIKALEQGINVLCEKPMAMNADECNKVMNAAEKSGKRYMTAQVVRFMNPYKYLANIIKNNTYGKLIRLDMKRLSTVPNWSWDNWMLDEKRSGHVVLDLMLHDIDYIQSVLGMPKDIDGVYYDMKDMSNYASINYLYDGCSISVEGSWYNAEIEFEASFYAVFEKGSIRLKDNTVYDCGKPIDLGNLAINENTGINISNVDGYGGEIEYFIDCVKNGKSPEIVMPQSSAQSISLVELTREKLTTI